MNNRGEQNQLGILLVVFITVIVGLIILTAAAQQVGSATSTTTIANDTLGAAAADGVTQYITGYKSLTDVVIFNATGAAIIPADNYTVTNNAVYNGAEAVSITPTSWINVTPGGAVGVWKYSGTAQPTTYISDGGGRAVAGIIILMFAIAIVIITISPTAKNKILGI